jgi:DNA-binding SARP family transcriptional activator/predicted ATPase
LLAVNVGRPVSADQAIEALWDNDGQLVSANAVQVLVSRLRRALAVLGNTSAIETVPGGYRFSQGVFVDAAEFQRLLTLTREKAGDDQDETVTGYREALGLWRGPALADVRGNPVLDREADYLDHLKLSVEEEWTDAELAVGNHISVVDRIERLVAEEPLREKRWAQLMTALYRCGRQAEALRAFKEARQVLADELGVEPSPLLVMVEEQVLLQDQALDLETIRPPLRRSIRLPVETSTFIGRAQEAAEVDKLVRGARLVTITGVGGAGKTRLAAYVAKGLASSFDSVYWLTLSQAAPGVHVAAIAGRAMGLLEPPDGDWEQLIAEYLSGGRSLLVIDSCEFATASVAPFIATLQADVAALTILATSRQKLGLSWEVNYRLEGLTVPHVDATPRVAIASDSMRLMLARIALNSPTSFPDEGMIIECSELCRQLGGLPLGIELVAAGLSNADKGTPLLDVAREWTDGADRHRSLRLAFDWSLDRLDGLTKEVFQRLSSFVGSFDVEDAIAVCAFGSVEPDNLGQAISVLWNASLLERRSNSRFSYLDPVREAATALAVESGLIGALDMRHADYFFRMVEDTLPRLQKGHSEALDLVDRVLPEVLAACRRVRDRVSGRVLQVGANLRDYFVIRARFHEGRRFLADLLATTEGREDDRLGVRLAQGAIETALTANEALPLLEGVVADARRLGRKCIEAEALMYQENVYTNIARWEEAVESNEQFGRAAKACGDARFLTYHTFHQSTLKRHARDFAAAVALDLEATDQFAEQGDHWGLAWILGWRGEHQLGQGRIDEGRDILLRAHEIFVGMQNPWGELFIGWNLGICYLLLEEFGAVRAIARRIIELGELSGYGIHYNPCGWMLHGWVAWKEGNAETAREAFTHSLESSRRAGPELIAIELVWIALGVAEIMMAEHRWTDVAQLLSAIAKTQEALTQPWPMLESGPIANLREALSDQGVQWSSEGGSMHFDSLSEVVDRIDSMLAVSA